MGDQGDYWRDVREASREHRKLHAIPCPGCPKVQPKRIPTNLLPGQKCRVCGYRRERKSIAASRVIDVIEGGE